MSKVFFITATGTDIGKTFFVEKFCRELIGRGEKCNAIKPVISGFSDEDLNSDLAKILKVLGKEINAKNIAEISPWRFTEPLSPNIAAELESKSINFLEVVNFCQNKIDKAKKNGEYLLIEGAGGVMTPITHDKTFLDLIEQLKIPVILVTGNYLGTISHTLTAVTAIENRNIKIDQIIFNCQGKNKADEKIVQTLKTLTKNQISIL
jgi:dethiobiotin synthetase